MANLHIISHWKTEQDSWDESWYDANDSLEAAVDFYKTSSGVGPALVQWRGRGTTLLGFTVVEEGGLRRALPVEREIDATRGSSSTTDEKYRRDAPNRSAKYTIGFVGGGRRVYDIRGIADIDVITPIGQTSRLSAYADEKANAMMAWLKDTATAAGRRLVDAVGEPWKTVQSLKPHPVNPNWAQFTVPTAVTVPQVGDLVYLRGWNRATELWLKGYWRVVDANNTTHVFSIPTTYLAQVAEIFPRNMQFRRAVYDYPRWAVTGFKGVSSRKTRGPFDGRAGRSSGLKLRRLTPAV